MAEPVDYEDLSHLGRTLNICGWTKSEVTKHFGTDFVERTKHFRSSPFGRFDVPSGTDEQMVYGAQLSCLYVYLREGLVLHAFEEWSDWRGRNQRRRYSNSGMFTAIHSRTTFAK